MLNAFNRVECLKAFISDVMYYVCAVWTLNYSLILLTTNCMKNNEYQGNLSTEVKEPTSTIILSGKLAQ
jgi:hypothetical protein